MRDTYDRFQPQDRGRFGDNEYGSQEVEKRTGSKKLHDLDCAVIERRERAVKVRLQSNGRYEWFPLSHCEVSAKENGRGHSIAVPEWLLNQKGIL